MQNWSKLVFVLILCNSLIVTGEKKNPTLSFLRYRVVPARQVPFPASPEGSPGNGTWLAGTTLSRRMTAWDSLTPVMYPYSMMSGVPCLLTQDPFVFDILCTKVPLIAVEVTTVAHPALTPIYMTTHIFTYNHYSHRWWAPEYRQGDDFNVTSSDHRITAIRWYASVPVTCAVLKYPRSEIPDLLLWAPDRSVDHSSNVKWWGEQQVVVGRWSVCW